MNNLGIGTPFAGNVLSNTLYRADYTAPVIAWWDSLPDDNDPGNGYGPYTVKAVAADFSGIDSANLYYEINSVSMPRVPMTRAAADTFVAVIPAIVVMPESTKTVAYNVHFWDHAHNPYGAANYGATSGRYFWLRNLIGVAGNPNGPALPKIFALQPCRPNPARGTAEIVYQLPRTSAVTLDIYSITGQLVKRFDEGIKQPGYYSIRWDAAGHGAGVYFYRLRAGEYQSTKKLVVIR
jgi:hypothetical protein